PSTGCAYLRGAALANLGGSAFPSARAGRHTSARPSRRRPSRDAMVRPGKRRVTPPRNIALQAAWLAAAKWPIWLKVTLDGESRSPDRRAPLWNDGAML